MLLYGTSLASSIESSLRLQVADSSIVPSLAIISIGQNTPFTSHLQAIKKSCSSVGIKLETIVLPSDVTESEVTVAIKNLNEDVTVHGILLQLPLPDHLDLSSVASSIEPSKDVDRIHPKNVDLFSNSLNSFDFAPSTAKACVLLLESVCPLDGKKVVVIGRSLVAGKPIAKLLTERGAVVTACHSQTTDLSSHTRSSDVIIAAAGCPHLVSKDMVKENAIVIDVGINSLLMEDGSRTIVGDVDTQSVADVAQYITPVPGGVGPVTIACLMENVCLAAGIRINH